MKFLRTAWEELIGLFVDDWAFALLVLLWAGVFALPPVRAHARLAAPALFGGLAVLTLAFVVRRARR